MAYERKKIKSFSLFYDMFPQIRELTTEERGEFLTAIFEYLIENKDAEFPNADRMLRGLWKSTKQKLDNERDDFYRRNDIQKGNRTGNRSREHDDQEPP